MMQGAERRVQAKLIRIMVGVFALTAAVILSVTVLLQSRAEATRLATLEREVSRTIESNARVLVESHALALSSLEKTSSRFARLEANPPPGLGNPLEASPVEAVGPVLDAEAGRSPRLVELFSTRIAGPLDAMRSAIVAGAAGELSQAAHKLKGSCLGLGAPAFAALCEGLEEESMAGEMSYSERRLAEVRGAFEQVAIELAKEQPEPYSKARALRRSTLPLAA